MDTNPLLGRTISVAFGNNRLEKHWKNKAGTVRNLIDDLSKFVRGGTKDGRCLLQGEVVEGDGGKGVARTWKNMRANHIMMFDYDLGTPLQEIADSVKGAGLFALLWTTWSHLKPYTLIPEDKMLAYMASKGMRGVQPMKDDIMSYLHNVARMPESVLKGAEVKGSEHVEGGVKFRVLHERGVPRVRVLFVLKEPFVFAERGGSQKQAAEEWKAYYAAVSEMLGLPYDKSCVDPSRLMYTPRVSKDAVIGPGAHEIIEIDGAPLDLTKITIDRSKLAASADRPTGRLGVTGVKNPFEVVGETGEAGTRHFETPGLAKFLGIAASDFEAADWMASYGYDAVVEHGGGMDCACPNADSHSTGDAGFMVLNASYEGPKKQGAGFTMLCLHEGCKLASGEDRAWYLDQLCQEFGVADAMELITPEFCPNVYAKLEAERKKAEETKTLANDHTTLAARILAFNERTTLAELEPVLEALAMNEDSLVVDDFVDSIAENTKKRAALLRKEVRRIRAKTLEAEMKNGDGDDAPETRPIPDDLGKATKIWLDWPWPIIGLAVRARFIHLNDKNPYLFVRSRGDDGEPSGYVRVTTRLDGRVVVQSMGESNWAAEIDDNLRFCKIDADGIEREVQPPARLDKTLMGAVSRMDLPDYTGLIKVPVFGPDGSLKWDRGYCPALKAWLAPNGNFLPLPETLTDDHVVEAVDLLMEAIGDFPFSDGFSGSDNKPIKNPNAAPDERGYRPPNWNRGVSSRANCIALMLQPFARHLIPGSCPAYHVGKATPGTGASYLMDIVFTVTEGKRSKTTALSGEKEEVRKALTSALLTMPAVLFFDNINHKVDSGALAGAITSGTWSDRILGQSEITNIAITAALVFAGNNLTFSPELMRRNVPIMLDANSQNPDLRPPSDFRNWPMHSWVDANRVRLVQACHILIQNWINKGMRWGTVGMASFEGYAGVMSGILDAAGIVGFLENRKSYMGAEDDDRDVQLHFAQRLYDEHGTAKMTLGEMLAVSEAGQEGGDGAFIVPLPDTKGDNHRKHISFGAWVAAQMRGRTFDVQLKPEYRGPHHLEGSVDGTTVTRRLKLVRTKPQGSTRYHFEPVN